MACIQADTYSPPYLYCNLLSANINNKPRMQKKWVAHRWLKNQEKTCSWRELGLVNTKHIVGRICVHSFPNLTIDPKHSAFDSKGLPVENIIRQFTLQSITLEHRCSNFTCVAVLYNSFKDVYCKH
jgi:hypothetical protein